MFSLVMSKNNGFLKNLVLLIIILLIFVIILEVILRISYPLYANYNTEMWRYSVLLKKASNNPDVSHEHIPNKEAFLYGVNIKINSQGFRDKEYSLEKPKETYRIMVLGDSFTLGWGVPIEDVYSKVLEKKLNENSKGNKFEVINTALGNYNTQMEYEVLKEKYLQFEPDMIIVGYYPNDPELTKKFSEKSLATIYKRNSYTYAFFWDRIVNIKTKFAARKSNNGYTGYVHELYKEDFEGRKLMESSLNGIIDLAKKNNITVIVIVLPQFFGDFKNYEFTEVFQAVNSITSKKGVLSIDMVQYFKGYEIKDLIISFEDAHPNKLGHRIIADVLHDTLTSRIPEIKKNIKA